MRVKILTAIALVSVVALAGTLQFISRGEEDGLKEEVAKLEAKENAGTLTLDERILLAKVRGQKHLVVPGTVSYYAEAESVDDALSYYSVVVVEPVEIVSVRDQNNDIWTWHKFRVLEKLSDPSRHSNAPLGPPPDFLLPVGEDELVVLKPGGTVLIDGISVRSPEHDFPPLTKGRNFLLFLTMDPDSRVGRIDLGPTGVLNVSADGTITPFTEEARTLFTELTGRYGNSIAQVRQGLKLRSHST